MYHVFRLCVLLSLVLSVNGVGLLILYRPHDVTNHCAYSSKLRYDISFGMGLSDTITLVFHTLNYIDYECVVEIVADSPDVHIVISILYPNPITYNCFRQPNAITVLKKNTCFKLCDTLDVTDMTSAHFVTSVKERFRFHFRSNSSINLDMNAHMYQVTATAARLITQEGPIRKKRCYPKNETSCVIKKNSFCFTSGVVCDGIKNCGVPDWSDERKSECALSVEKLGFPPVFAVSALILCVALAACHCLSKCLPPLASSFFVFNANEDNRLYIDPIFTSPVACLRDIRRVQRLSLVPVSSDSSSCDYTEVLTRHKLNEINQFGDQQDSNMLRRTNTMRSMTVKLQERLRSVARGNRKSRENFGMSSKKSRIYDV